MYEENALVYLDGGKAYIGYKNSYNIRQWEEYGREKKQKYMYTGYRFFPSQEEDIVIVFDVKKWDKKELKRRDKNGFHGIQKYNLTQ